MASSPAHLQALLDALAAFCHTLHMEVSVVKTKVMVVAAGATSPVVFTCNGQAIEQVQSFRYLGLHFHSSGSISHLISPMKAKAAGSWAVVQQYATLFSPDTNIMRSFFGQKDHMQVFRFVLDCLDFHRPQTYLLGHLLLPCSATHGSAPDVQPCVYSCVKQSA